MNTTTKVIVGLMIVIALGIGVWLAAPLFYDKRVNEELPVSSSAAVVTPVPTTQSAGSQAVTTPAPTTQGVVELSSGTFTGFDDLHQAAGTARLVQVDGKTYVRFEGDFTVTNGPDLYVYFGNNNEYIAETNLGRLKGNIGSQNYEVPTDIDASQYSEVWVWCRAFAVPFGKAVLQ